MAGKIWCAKDPIVRLNGQDVQIWVAIPEEYVPYVNGAVRVNILTPNDVTREVIFLDEGFNGYGEEVRFGDLAAGVAEDGSFPAQVRVKVPLDKHALGRQVKRKDVPLQLTINLPDGTSQVVEMTNDGTWIEFTVAGSK
jgi:hypothetical protein